MTFHCFVNNIFAWSWSLFDNLRGICVYWASPSFWSYFFLSLTSMFLRDIDAHTTLYLPDSRLGYIVFSNALLVANLIYPLPYTTPWCPTALVAEISLRLSSVRHMFHKFPPNDFVFSFNWMLSNSWLESIWNGKWFLFVVEVEIEPSNVKATVIVQTPTIQKHWSNLTTFFTDLSVTNKSSSHACCASLFFQFQQ